MLASENIVKGLVDYHHISLLDFTLFQDKSGNTILQKHCKSTVLYMFKACFKLIFGCLLLIILLIICLSLCV